MTQPPTIFRGTLLLPDREIPGGEVRIENGRITSMGPAGAARPGETVIDAGDGLLRAVFERRGEPLVVRPTRLASVESLYAITIHKSQGSQFGHVVVRLPDPGSPVLTRELLYTAVTRAQQRLTVLGTEAAVRAAVARPVARASGLTAALTPT